ncbi:MAG: N-acyl amino acid synthase FeeM domain-containing protein [Chitinispirillaceae bacterium]
MVTAEQNASCSVFSEKRKDPRAFLTVAVTLVVGDRIIRGTECRNISMSGMLVRVEEMLHIGETATITMTKRCNEEYLSFSSCCNITRCAESSEGSYHIAVSFCGMDSWNEEILKQIVDYQISLMFKKRIIFDQNRTTDFVLKIADTREELEQAFRLLHDTYVREKFMKPHPSGLRIRFHNAAPCTVVIVGKKAGEVVLTTSLYVDSFLGIPADTTFREEIGKLRSEGRYFAEVGSLAAREDVRSADSTLQLLLQKMILLYSIRYLKLDDLIITVVCKHESYYRHILLFEPIGESRCYEGANNASVVPMRLNLEQLEQKYKEAYKYLPKNKKLDQFVFRETSPAIILPEKQAPKRIWNKDLIDYFFCRKTDVFKYVDSKKVSRIKSYYL